MSNVIIGFGSTARVGKDFACAIIKELIPSTNRVAFADALKEDLASLFTRNKLDFFELTNDEEEKKKIRPLMVEYGQLMRRYNESVWIDRALEKLDAPGLHIVTDVRFPNEVQRIKEKGGIYVHVSANVPPANDVEAELLSTMSALADHKLFNDFTFNYNVQVVELLKVILNQQGFEIKHFL